MLNNSRNIAISGGHFVVHQSNFAFEKLQKASAPSAFHDSSVRFDPPKCHPNTRVAILKYLMEWIFARRDPEALILWLYGPAGAGKSAILQTLAELCMLHNVPLASFFFGRSDPTRNTFNPLIATIAYQIAIAIPQIKPLIENAIESDPLIFDKSLATQLQYLIADPLKDLATAGFFRNPRNWPRLLILIDGLDEYNDPKMQSMILRVLANALRSQQLPLIFLIASRPELHLTRTFNSAPLVGLWRSLVLDDSFKPDEDIRLFLKDTFREIKSTHPHPHLIPQGWPEPPDVDKLVQKSSGQFIYASVVVKYISDPLGGPHHRLGVVINLTPMQCDGPFAELDTLYKYILGSCTDRDMALDTVLLVLGASICGVRWTRSILPAAIADIELIMGLQPGDGEITLAPLTSLIRLDKRFRKTTIHSYHASFRDFLTDISRSGQFYINTATIEENFLCGCLNILMDPSEYFRQLGNGTTKEYDAPLLWIPLRNIRPRMPFTETVQNALNKFSLPQVWSYFSHKSIPSRIRTFPREHAITVFLGFLRGRFKYEGHKQFYKFHLSSFESILTSGIRPYYQDVGLTSLLVATRLNIYLYQIPSATSSADNSRASQILFRLTNESISYNANTFCLALYDGRSLLSHYSYLFTGSTAPAEFRLDGHKHAQTALRILEFLCDHPFHPTPYYKASRKPQIPKHDSTRPRVSTKISHRLPQGVMRTQRVSDIGLPRKWREAKHRDRWVPLSFRLPRSSTLGPIKGFDNTLEYACMLGLLYLPLTLQRSSKSPELVDFIRTHGKDIVIVPEWTSKAVCAMHKYLDRREEDVVVEVVWPYDV